MPSQQSDMSASSLVPNARASTEPSSPVATGTSLTPDASTTTGNTAAEEQDKRTSEQVDKDTTGAAEAGSKTTSPSKSNH